MATASASMGEFDGADDERVGGAISLAPARLDRKGGRDERTSGCAAPEGREVAEFGRDVSVAGPGDE